ncbi:hypothetical protein [Kitasatospora kifunensis]|uniref:Uncharacterized protein n=1 Tax=Kitasatospora kifunensis TaxID=58351 RepID=A0A7W7VZT1_KITKI|nr:hypothetical protein [Kitasatospora kifunensis]MBB4929112.1 hypothetical protein [Kitasatospora kifunensis]
MPELPPAADAPSQPTATELAAWLHNPALTVEPEGDAGLRVRFTDRPGLPDPFRRRLALTEARARLESPSCPWTLAADAFTEDGQEVPRGDGPFTLLVRAITPQESAARREARTQARQQERSAARQASAVANAAYEAKRQEWLAAATPMPQAEQSARVDRPVRAIAPSDLPVLGYAHGPNHYHGHTEPTMFRPLGPDPVVRSSHPQRGAGLWTSPALEQDDDGTVLASVWSRFWASESPGDDRYSEHLRITPDPTARIALIDNSEDLLALVQQYPNPPDDSPFDDSHLFPNWPEVAADWDAVYLTADGARATAVEDRDQATAPHLDGWAGAAVLWLRPAYTVADGLGL